jgi:hypothetical protein
VVVAVAHVVALLRSSTWHELSSRRCASHTLHALTPSRGVALLRIERKPFLDCQFIQLACFGCRSPTSGSLVCSVELACARDLLHAHWPRASHCLSFSFGHVCKQRRSLGGGYGCVLAGDNPGDVFANDDSCRVEATRLPNVGRHEQVQRTSHLWHPVPPTSLLNLHPPTHPHLPPSLTLHSTTQIYGGLRKTLRDAAVFFQRRPVWVEHTEGRALTVHEEPLDAERMLVEAAGE